jgi:hypothetical protein
MSRRLFSHDAEAGITKWWHYDGDTDTAVIETQQDITDLIESNKRSYAAHEGTRRWGELERVATIPLSLYYKWMQEGKTRDQKFLRNFFNSSENRHLRTRPGRLDFKV